jgi:signal transduction histidine kinase
VADDGIGIPEEDLPHIFERFYRVEKSRSKRGEAGGGGLGLAIAKRIIDLHGSTLKVASTLNKGATFSFSLPKIATA